MQTIQRFQLDKGEDLMLFFVIYDSQVKIFRFVTVCLNETSDLKSPWAVWTIFGHFLNKMNK